MYGANGHREGAQLATLTQIRQTSTLPGWAITSLQKVGYAIGSERGPVPVRRGRHRRLARRTTRGAVLRPLVGRSMSGGSSFSAPVPVDRLFWIGASG